MLSAKGIVKIQAEFNLTSNDVAGSIDNTEITFDEYWTQYRNVISRQNPDLYIQASSEKRTEIMLQKAMEYVNTHSKVNVQGYMTPDGICNNTLLLEDLCSTISGEAVLKDALNDPDTNEIEIIDLLSLFVEKEGKFIPYVDKYGRRVSFPSESAIKTTLNRLMEDGNGNTPQFTEGIPILNGRTAKEKYRINAVHSVLNTRDSGKFDFPITTVSIRKFKKVKPTMRNYIEKGSCSEEMGEFILSVGKTKSRTYCVGATGSGKTTLLGLMAQEIPYNLKVVLIQNPTEIYLTERDDFGVNKRRVVHWEVKDDGSTDTTGTKGTMENLIANSLRVTPDIIIVGECRTPGEFAQTFRIAQTGHGVRGSYHAADEKEALSRAAVELASATGSSYEISLRQVVASTDFIITTTRYFTGERKIKSIAEIGDMDRHGNIEINVLFKYKAEGSEIDEAGKYKMKGKFIQTGVLSLKQQELFLESGIPQEVINKFSNNSDISTEFDDKKSAVI